MSLILTSFARSLRESICLRFFRFVAQSVRKPILSKVNTFPYRPRLINLYYFVTTRQGLLSNTFDTASISAIYVATYVAALASYGSMGK